MSHDQLGSDKAMYTHSIFIQKENSADFQPGVKNNSVACSDQNHDQMQHTVSSNKRKLSNEKEQLMTVNTQNDTGSKVHDCISAVLSLSSQSCTKKKQTEIKHHKANILPHNLPKKPQELFLRIKQKQQLPLDLSIRDHGEQDKTKH
jgi:hypothetical protein